MRGYKTLAANLLGLAAVWLGLEPETLQAWAREIVSGLAALNMALRFLTRGPVAGGKIDALLARARAWINDGGFIDGGGGRLGGLALAAALLPLALGACAALGPQAAAGLTSAHVTGEEYDAVGRVTKRCEATIRDGKERADTALAGKVCGSNFYYSAREVRAFRAFEIRAQVEEASIAALGEIVPDVVKVGMDAALAAFTGATVAGAARDAVAAKAALDAAKIKIEAAKAAGAGKPP